MFFHFLLVYKLFYFRLVGLIESSFQKILAQMDFKLFQMIKLHSVSFDFLRFKNKLLLITEGKLKMKSIGSSCYFEQIL